MARRHKNSNGSNLTRLESYHEVLRALGGNHTVMKLTNRRIQHLTNWAAVERFPAHTFLILTKELAEKGYTAPPALWGITPPKD
jgi:hypothetical protein